MHSVSYNRARRFGLIFLAFALPVLTGCGGGGGVNSASVPPQITSPSVSGLDSGAAAALINDIEGTGTAWLAMIEADDGRFSLNGRDPGTNNLLAKLPDPAIESQTIIPTSYSRFAHFSAILSPDHDPGRYMLWGRLYETLPPGPLTYAMKGLWTCTGCEADGSIIQHQATGRLDLDAENSTGQFSFSGAGLALETELSLEKSGALTAGGRASLTYQNQSLDISDTRINGGVFGPNAEEAGLLFGVQTEDRTFSGAALGKR